MSAECMGNAPHGPHEFNGGMHCPGLEDETPGGFARHQARRGDDVDAWLKRWRSEQSDSLAWQLVDDMVDDYHVKADLGVPLDAEVTG